MTIDSEHIDNLIARYLSGEASENERLQLESWMEESEVNRHYFADIRFVHDKAVASHRIVNVDVDTAWSNVRTQMKHPAGSSDITIRKSPINMSFWLKIAALVVFAFGLSFWLLTYYHSSGVASQPFPIVSNDSTLNYQFSDSSRAYLNKSSKISFTKQYGKKQREVNLSGEAYFAVRHDEHKSFIVNADGTCIKDIGTSFNVKAYPDSATIKVFVENGEVLFCTSDNPGIRLTKGETGIFDKVSRTFRKRSAVDANVLSYKTRVFIFQNDQLPEVIEKLNAVYRTQIRFNNKTLSNCKITVRFNNENIHTIATVIAETLGLKVIKTTDGYLLEGNGCSNP